MRQAAAVGREACDPPVRRCGRKRGGKNEQGKQASKQGRKARVERELGVWIGFEDTKLVSPAIVCVSFTGG